MHAAAFSKRKRIPSGSVNMDEEAKLMRSRVSARDCRARKKQRYQKLEAMVEEKEKSIIDLRKELQQVSTEKSDMTPPFLRCGVTSVLRMPTGNSRVPIKRLFSSTQLYDDCVKLDSTC